MRGRTHARRALLLRRTAQCKRRNGWRACASLGLVVAAFALGGAFAAGAASGDILGVVQAATTEPPPTTSATFDTTAPAMPSLRAKPHDPSNEPAAKFSWTGEDGVTFVCNVDGIAEPCTSPYYTDPLSEGPHVFEVRAKDAAGNLSAPATWNWTVDLTPPEPLTGVTALSGYGYVTLHWARPLSWETTDKIVITKTRAGSSTVTTVYQGAETLFEDGRVRNGYTYIYTLIPRDAAGNDGASLSERARPTGFLAPPHGTHALYPPLVQWVDVPNSTYANIQLYLVRAVGLKKIWSVWRLADELQLRLRWVYKGNVYRLRAGRSYRVYGWPGFGAKSEARYGEWFGWVDFTYR